LQWKFIIYGKLRIATTTAEELKKFKSTIEITKGIISSYRKDIDSLDNQAGSLLKFLKVEYFLTKN
jgi:hypothetical protein